MTASPSRRVPGLVPVTVAIGGASLVLMAARPEDNAASIPPAASRHDVSWDVVVEGNVLAIKSEADPEGVVCKARVEFEALDPQAVAEARVGERVLILLDGPFDVAVDPALNRRERSAM